MKGNKQEAEYKEPGKKTRETRSERTEGQVVRTGTEADERKQKERGKPGSESRREAPVEQLWERNREG